MHSWMRTRVNVSTSLAKINLFLIHATTSVHPRDLEIGGQVFLALRVLILYRFHMASVCSKSAWRRWVDCSFRTSPLHFHQLLCSLLLPKVVRSLHCGCLEIDTVLNVVWGSKTTLQSRRAHLCKLHRVIPTSAVRSAALLLVVETLLLP